MTDQFSPLRDHLIRALEWDEAHAAFEKAIDGLPAGRRGDHPAGFVHSAWDLLEHMRLAQKDLLDFCANANYKHTLKWPDDYWPKNQTPSDADWNASVNEFKADRAKLQQLVRNPAIDLFALVPTGEGRQTYLRAIMIVVDHNAYHLGQLIAVRKALEMWS
jgi:uncharacterized damage-inducible protein DinB